MNRAQRITVAVSGLVVAGLLALAVAPVVRAASWASERFAPASGATTEPSSSTEGAGSAEEAAEADGLVHLGDGISRPAGGPGDCAASAFISIRAVGDGPAYATLLGEPVEMGPRPGASGGTILDADGQLVAYEVVPDDNLIAIGERFCIDYITVAQVSQVLGTIHPGDVLLLRPDPTLPRVSAAAPRGAEAGFRQGPYQAAIYAFADAVAARDLAAARSLWDGYLSTVLGPSDGVATIAQALAESDWAALQEMFP